MSKVTSLYKFLFLYFILNRHVSDLTRYLCAKELSKDFPEFFLKFPFSDHSGLDLKLQDLNTAYKRYEVFYYNIYFLGDRESLSSIT